MAKIKPCFCNGKTIPIPTMVPNGNGNDLFKLYCPLCRHEEMGLSYRETIWSWNEKIRIRRKALGRVNRK